VFRITIVRRVQIHLDEALDATAAAEAARRGISKAALIRAGLARELDAAGIDPASTWEAMIGWIADGGMDDVDEVVYGPAHEVR